MSQGKKKGEKVLHAHLSKLLRAFPGGCSSFPITLGSIREAFPTQSPSLEIFKTCLDKVLCSLL